MLRQPLNLRQPGQTNSEEGIARDRAFAERVEVTEKLKALRIARAAALAQLDANTGRPTRKRASKRG
jgi:molybdenum cofactor biosynthesis enzyme